MKNIQVPRKDAISTLLIWDEPEGILDQVTLDQMNNAQLSIEMNARQTPSMGEYYTVVDVTHKQEIRNAVDDYFALIARRINLETGDITPEQEDRLDRAVENIADVLQEWKTQNGGDNRE